MERSDFIGAKINSLSHVLRQDLTEKTAYLDLTATQSFILGHLVHHRSRPLYQKDLEDEFQFSHATASGILSRLEAKGFVLFRPDKNDRRRKQILVTDKAADCHDEIVRHIKEANARVTAGMTDEEVAELHRLLDLALRNMGVEPTCRHHHTKQEETQP